MNLAKPILTGFFILFVSSTAYAKLENGMDADVVIGQPDFATNNLGYTQTKFGYPIGVYSDGKKLFVTNRFGRRVLIYNSIPMVNGAPADVVVGQTNFTSSGAGTGANQFSNLVGVFSDGQRLFVPEDANRRLLVWNTIPTSNGTSSDYVLGQPDFATTSAGTTQSKMGGTSFVFFDGTRLFVVDHGNHRIMIWNGMPTTTFAPADVVLGQPDFVTGTSGTTQKKMFDPSSVYSDGKMLFITEQTNNRVMIYNDIPTQNNAPADIVLGQPDFTSNSSGLSQSGMNSPSGVVRVGNRIFVTDGFNNRVLVWNNIPKINNAPADIVLGQPNFTTNTARAARDGMSFPFGISSDGRRLFVGEYNNHRVLIFNLFDGPTIDLSPQFTQGKGVLGKVFNDVNGNGVQDEGEKGIEGFKVVSDTGIYALTDPDGKYHFPYIETGQHILKIDESTLPEGSSITTESPRKILVTEGVLTKVSFGIKLSSNPTSSLNPHPPGPLLKASISQDPVLLKPTLSIEAKEDQDKITFTIRTNYQLFIEKAELTLYNDSMKLIQTLELPKPLPYTHTVLLSDIPTTKTLYYRLTVTDKEGRQDRAALGRLTLEAS